MIRQYHAQRRRGGDNPLGVGTIPIGSIFYVQDRSYWADRYGGTAIRRDPMIVTGFLNGKMEAARRDPDTGHWQSIYMGNRTDLALLRSLRDGRTKIVRIGELQALEERGLYKEMPGYPSRPNLNFYRRGALLAAPCEPAAKPIRSPNRKRPARPFNLLQAA